MRALLLVLLIALAVAAGLLIRLWLRNAVLDRQAKSLQAKYPLLAVPGLSRRQRRDYVTELLRREQEEYDGRVTAQLMNGYNFR
ncbi:hypothetical protein [Mycolicibacterium sphagni]|uniref:hypothetical protein n=1 Tax=Mycolicibacterium sphagni TaxID=1786 RepID=UPI0013FD5228|nr:hypothetical protein [Mycolicibacterium sphagni]